jgi:uncharacterized protein with PIN domain
MRAVDTKVLVRLIARDEQHQAATAEAFVATGAWVSHLVLAETVWVLDAVHGLPAERITTAVEMRQPCGTFALGQPWVSRIAWCSRLHARQGTCRSVRSTSNSAACREPNA